MSGVVVPDETSYKADHDYLFLSARATRGKGTERSQQEHHRCLHASSMAVVLPPCQAKGC
jgi:hypothetical protein